MGLFVDFANPSIFQTTNTGNNITTTIVTLFVPSEAINADTPITDKAGCLVYTLPSLD